MLVGGAVMLGPGDQTSASEGRSHGDLHATPADRERVIGTLKAAFVQGMLAKDDPRRLAERTLVAEEVARLPAVPGQSSPVPGTCPAKIGGRVPGPRYGSGDVVHRVGGLDLVPGGTAEQGA